MGLGKEVGNWKRLKGKNFRELLRRKPSSEKISKISRNSLRSNKNNIAYLLRNLMKCLLRTFFFRKVFQKFLPFAFLPSGSFRGNFQQTHGDACRSNFRVKTLVHGGLSKSEDI